MVFIFIKNPGGWFAGPPPLPKEQSHHGNHTRATGAQVR